MRWAGIYKWRSEMNKLTVKEWEQEAGYGGHRICSCCNSAIIKRVPNSDCIQSIECYFKKVATGSGAVKSTKSCMNWNPRLFELSEVKSVPIQDIFSIYEDTSIDTT
jgi:hypothetical protein